MSFHFNAGRFQVSLKSDSYGSILLPRKVEYYTHFSGVRFLISKIHSTAIRMTLRKVLSQLGVCGGYLQVCFHMHHLILCAKYAAKGEPGRREKSKSLGAGAFEGGQNSCDHFLPVASCAGDRTS